jgi:hypothetical protein
LGPRFWKDILERVSQIWCNSGRLKSMSSRIKAIHLSSGYNITRLRSVHSKCTLPCNAAGDLLRNSAEVFVSAQFGNSASLLMLPRNSILWDWFWHNQSIIYIDNIKTSYTWKYQTVLYTSILISCLIYDNIKLSYISILITCLIYDNIKLSYIYRY